MATDLSTLTKTELTELLSSVTPYSKQEMISFLRMKVKILDNWEKDDIAHTATIHFTPIKDVRALKYIEQHPNMGAGGGGAVFFQFLRHPATARDNGTAGAYETTSQISKIIGWKRDKTSGYTEYVTEQIPQKAVKSIYTDDYISGFGNNAGVHITHMGNLNRSKYKLGHRKPSKPVYMLYPEHLVASIYYEYSPDGGTTYYRPRATVHESYIDTALISQWVKDRIEDGTYTPSIQTRSQATDAAYGVGDSTEYFWTHVYSTNSVMPSDKIALSRVMPSGAANGGAYWNERTYAILTPFIAVSGDLTVYTSNRVGPTNVLKTVWKINSLPGYNHLDVYSKAAAAGHSYIIWAPELIVEGNHRQWFLNEKQGIRPDRAFINIR